MARLYEYADSNDRSGYFLRGGSSDGNYTMRATELGRRLLDRLGYKPGTVNAERGPRIPPQLQWAMYDVGLLMTGGDEPSGAGFDGELNAEDAEITEAQMEELEAFVFDGDTDREEIQELADILDVEPEEPSRTPIWELDESALKDLESVYEAKLTEELDTDEREGLDLVVTYESDISDDDDILIFGVDVISEEEGLKDHYYQMYYARGRDNGVSTVTRGDVGPEERVAIDRQRGRVLEAMSEVPLLTGLDIGDPGENLNMLTLEGDLSVEY